MLELVSFLCGAGVMVLEMAGARILAPFLGTSIVVWTAMIGVVLASLSLGYWLGGKAGDRNPSARRLGLIIASGAAFVLFAAVTQAGLLSAVAEMRWPLQVSAVVAAVILFAVPCVFLGMVSPYIIQVRLLDYPDKSRSSTVIGRFYALSTIGSIAGTFLGGYWLISLLGTRVILYAVAGVLALAAILVMPRGRALPAALVFGACLSLGGYAAFSTQESLASGIDIDTRYNHIRIIEGMQDSHTVRYMITDPGSAQSGMRVDDPDYLLFDYTKHYAIGRHIKEGAKTFLMLGGGGYSVPRHLLRSMKDVAVDVVEIDPGVTQAAMDYFALRDDPRMRIFHEDARVFLNRAAAEGGGKTYDMIMGDTFSSSYNIPFHLGTVECAERIHALLNEDGVFVCNIISAVTGPKGRVLRSIRAAFAKVFPQTHVFPVSLPHSPDTVQNVMLVALKTEKNLPLAWDEPMREMLAKEYKQPLEEDVIPLTDGFAPVERYAMPMLDDKR